MTEEIIVDGVNVAGCEFYSQDEKYSCDLSFINQEELCKCDDVQDCTYKQFKRLEQENSELRAEIESFMNGDYCANGCKKMNNAFCDAHTAIINENNRLRSALEEIREIVTSAFAKQRPYKEDFAEIETRINEVLNE